MGKISAVYQVINTVTGERYVGSSRNVMKRWADHKCPSTWKECPNSPLYHDFQKYGVDKFSFQILAPVMPEHLKQVEQEFIEMIHPSYNNYRANGWDVERIKEYNREYNQSEKRKESRRKWRQSEKGKEHRRKYLNQLCRYNGEELTLNTLSQRFQKAGIEHPTIEAKKYLKII